MSTEESAKELIPVPVLVATALGPFVPPMSPLISASSSVPERTIFDKSKPLDSKSSSVPYERKQSKEDSALNSRNCQYQVCNHISYQGRGSVFFAFSMYNFQFHI